MNYTVRQTIRRSGIVTIRRISFAFSTLNLLPNCLGDKFGEGFFIALGHPGFLVILALASIFVALHCAILGVMVVMRLRQPIVVFAVFAEVFML